MSEQRVIRIANDPSDPSRGSRDIAEMPEGWREPADDEEIEMHLRNMCACLPCLDKMRLINRINELKGDVEEANYALMEYEGGGR